MLGSRSVRSRLVALCAIGALLPIAAACSGGSGGSVGPGSGGSAPAGAASSSATAVATRWWSNSAARSGTTIDPKNPQAAAGHLHASKADYCAMLNQTVAAGKSILPGVTANDPALLTSTKAFVAEIEAVAPPTVAGAWKELGSAVIALVGSGGDPAMVNGVDAAAVRQAASTVAADAKRSCRVDLSS
ncbi:MAG TPA: hypothetical protein VHS54_00650 [Jatrophihabitans sp.]|jgi:hypothetical protein|nr:hypothetical protein [Jatrophihabitans sp.]